MKSLTRIFPLNLLQPANGNALSLRSRVQKGGVFTVGGFGVGQVLRLISNLILTRLLAPDAFGLMAVAVSINVWAIMLTDIGIGSSVVRSRNSDDPEFVRTAWTMQIMRNSLVWALIATAAIGVYVLAHAGVFRAESAYTNPLLPWIMISAGGQLLISAFSSVNGLMAQRKLSVGRIIALEIATQLFTMTVTISFAALGLGVWALVIGMLSGSAASMTASHFVYPGPPMRLRFKREYALEIFHFGKWLIIASFFGFIVQRGDQILFGGLMPSERFGLYAVASIWIIAAATVIQTIVGRVFYPAFSEILRDRPHDLTRAYYKVRLLVDAGAATLAFGAFFFSEFAFSILYPANYGGVGHYVKLLSPFLLLLPYRLINTTVLAAGDSRNFTGVTVLAGSAMLILTPAAYRFLGEKAAVVCFAAIELVALPIIWRIGARHLKLDPVKEGRALIAMIILLVLIFTVG